jgi:hypothetical protein
VSDAGNPLTRQLDLLLSGHGFNYYKAENRARADDLLVRERAAGALSAAVGALSNLHGAYRRQFIPPPSRESPFPPAEESRRAQDILVLRDRIANLASLIRGMSAPTQDLIWRRFRQELDLLDRLLHADSLLIDYADRVAARTEALTPSGWRDGTERTELEQMVGEVERSARDRQALLQFL